MIAALRAIQWIGKDSAFNGMRRSSGVALVQDQSGEDLLE
jgi:hypothetical protein